MRTWANLGLAATLGILLCVSARSQPTPPGGTKTLWVTPISYTPTNWGSSSVRSRFTIYVRVYRNGQVIAQNVWFWPSEHGWAEVQSGQEVDFSQNHRRRSERHGRERVWDSFSFNLPVGNPPTDDFDVRVVHQSLALGSDWKWENMKTLTSSQYDWYGEKRATAPSPFEFQYTYMKTTAHAVPPAHPEYPGKDWTGQFKLRISAETTSAAIR